MSPDFLESNWTQNGKAGRDEVYFKSVAPEWIAPSCTSDIVLFPIKNFEHSRSKPLRNDFAEKHDKIEVTWYGGVSETNRVPLLRSSPSHRVESVKAWPNVTESSQMYVAEYATSVEIDDTEWLADLSEVDCLPGQTMINPNARQCELNAFEQ